MLQHQTSTPALLTTYYLGKRQAVAVLSSAIRDAVVINAAQVMVTADQSSRYEFSSQDLDVLHADMGYLSTVASLSDVSLTLEGVVMQHQGQPLRQRQLPRQLPRLRRQQAQSLSLQARRLYRRCPPAL
jgi:hypothetical protein